MKIRLPTAKVADENRQLVEFYTHDSFLAVRLHWKQK